jgi:hypothetical protein
MTQVEAWLVADVSWTPRSTDRHAEVLGSWIRKYRLVGNLVTDEALAALAIEHGRVQCSADTNFACFEELAWENPLSGAR